MGTVTITAPNTSTNVDAYALRTLLSDWRTSLKARNISPATVKSYTVCANNLIDYLERMGMPVTTGGVRREHIESFLADAQDRWAAATVAKHYRSLQQLWKWLEDEGEIERNPMAKMKPPQVPEQPVAILTDDELVKLLKAADGTGFVERRDTAILRCYIDTGCRLDEIASLRVEDVDFDQDVLHVLGKGRRGRNAPFGQKTSEALRRYLRMRSRHQLASGTDKLWVGSQGGMTGDGLYRAVRRRAEQAGIGPIHPHQFRHTAAHVWLANGGQETDLMRIMGWRSRQMVERYARSAADERAREAHKRFKFGDRI